MYVADWEQYRLACAAASTPLYTKAEEACARQAYELLRTSGFPSLGAYDLYGTPPEYVRGKMTKKKVSRAVITENLTMTGKRQALYSDVMHIDGYKFLVTTCEPLQLTLQCLITSESQNQLGLALQGHISILRIKGFIPAIIYTDPAKDFNGLIGAFPGILVDNWELVTMSQRLMRRYDA